MLLERLAHIRCYCMTVCGAAGTCMLHADAVVDGGPFRRFVAARAERLLRLAAHAAPELRVTEPRALAAHLLGRAHRVDGVERRDDRCRIR